MKSSIKKSKIHGKITCPPNKSYTHRAIFLAALSDGKSIVKNILKSNDTIATINACKSFGVEVHEENDIVTIKNTIGSTVNGSVIDAQNSGTTIRIAIAVAALSGGNTMLTGDESLKKRPMKPILNAVETMGVTSESNDGKPPITIKGKIIGDEASSILINNHRIRVQIPGTDDISNLPWHQDSQYNSFYKENNSIVIWTSLNDINHKTKWPKDT